MNDEDKNRFDSVLELNRQCWNRIDQRRTYKWRLAFALWGLIIGLVGLLFTTMLAGKWQVFLGVAALGVATAILHAFWLKDLNGAMHTDRRMAVHYSTILQQMTQSEFPRDFGNQLDERAMRYASFWTSWSILHKWLGTLIFVFAALLVAAFRIWGMIQGIIEMALGLR